MKQASESSNTDFSLPVDRPPCALEDVDTLVLEGPDAADFAHAQLASDVKGLAVGQWQWTCLLTAQGRVVMLGLLLRARADRLLLLAPGLRAAELAERLRRFVLRRAVRLQVDRTPVQGRFDAAVGPAPNVGGTIGSAGEALRIDLGGRAGRSLWLGAGPQPAATGARADWGVLDAIDGIPWVTGAAVEAWIPQALGLARLAAFSTRKGCYPGQEIVARTHFLGRNKRSLRWGRLDALHDLPAPGTRLHAMGSDDEADALAVVVHAASGPTGGALLAVVRDDAPATLRPPGAGPPVVLLPFPERGETGAVPAEVL